MSVFIESTARRAIDRLRETWPDEDWTYDGVERRWRSSAGREVYSCAALAPQTPCDDDSYTIRYYVKNPGEGAAERLYGVSPREGRVYRGS